MFLKPWCDDMQEPGGGGVRQGVEAGNNRVPLASTEQSRNLAQHDEWESNRGSQWVRSVRQHFTSAFRL
jgi:hypothetical protein